MFACLMRSFLISHKHAVAVIATDTAMTHEIKTINLVPSFMFRIMITFLLDYDDALQVPNFP